MIDKNQNLTSRLVNAVLLLGLITLITSGCSEYKFPLESVSGKVTLDGNPVSDAKVLFMPRTSQESGEAGPYSVGQTDSEGMYELATITRPERNGAVVGNHRIVITTRVARSDPKGGMREIVEVKEIIPRPYSDPRRTTLRFEVPVGGTDAANFDLTSR